MVISGLTKVSLVDYPGVIAATVFTRGCNFLCPFCHNPSLVAECFGKAPTIDAKEVLEYIRKRSKIIQGVCITGGEPLLHETLTQFIAEIKSMGLKVKLDTNGSFPKRLEELIKRELVDYIAMDIKNSRAKYSESIGKEGYDTKNIEESVNILKKGQIEYEFRMTLVKGMQTKESIKEIGEWLKGDSKFFIQRFRHEGEIINDYTKQFGKMSEPEDNFIKAVLEILRTKLPRVEERG